jgi:hypothetical protein
MGVRRVQIIRLDLIVCSLQTSQHPEFAILTVAVINSCYRHDFGYRNFKLQNRFDANKARIDDNFKTDMFNQCATESAKGPCEATATLYYEAVKAFGKREENA